MGKCKSCGKFGLFLKIDSAGNCPDCAQRVERAAYVLGKKKEVGAFLDSLRRVPVVGDALRVPLRHVSDLDELHYTGVTAKTDAEKLGRFVVVDTETGGLAAGRDVLLEVAAVRCENFEPVEVFQTFVNPGRAIPAEATAINGITNEMVAGAPVFADILPALQSFIDGYNLVGHNLEFDLKFLYRRGLDVENGKRKFYDTRLIAKTCLKAAKFNYSDVFRSEPLNDNYDVYDYKLETLCDEFHIFRADAHRALGDAYDTARLFKALYDYKRER